MEMGMFHTFQRTKGYTATADTVINVLVPPSPDRTKKTKVTAIQVKNQGTAHTLTCLRPLGKTTVASVAAAGQAVVNLTADPGDYDAGAVKPGVADNPAAAGDYLAFEMPDGTYYFDTISSITLLAATLTSNVPTGGIAAGATVWFLGIAADTNPVNGQDHPFLNVPVSTTTNWQNYWSPLFQSHGAYEPLLLQESNETAAATVNYISGVYGP